MKISRRFTSPEKDVFDSVQWTTRPSRIQNPDGSVVFAMDDAEVPADWSQLATDIMVSKYFRKAGVPQADRDGKPVLDEQGRQVTGPERSARQVIHRLAGCWRYWGEKHGYFDTAEDAQAFYDEICYMLLTQMAAPNSPQWFNTGLNWAYGLSGPPQGHFYVDPHSGKPRRAEDAYTHPQPHACFIQSIEDDLVNEGGIMDLWVREARLFKYGSGTGTNFSHLRGEGEPLSGGGRSSGLMSFLRIGDRAAGAIKSGGTTRRAAKMVCLDLDHPDIEDFINWKVREELKVAAMVEGMRHLDQSQKQTAEALGLKLDYDFNGEAYYTVSGQNSNNSIRIDNRFFELLDAGDHWDLRRRTDGQVARSVPAQQLWDQIGYAAWRCADPGIQYDTTINQWHTCPAGGRINASNPCSEYMFLDDTACNLASLNLMRFFDPESRRFDADGFEHATRLWTIVLEISVLMAAFPSEQIARLSHEYRTLGLGYANLGAMLMQAGLPYDSEQARAICGSITAILTGRAYATSAEMAAELGAFPAYPGNREAMLRVIRNHRRAAYSVPRDATAARRHELGPYEELDVAPVPIDPEPLKATGPYGGLDGAEHLLDRARLAWDQALELGRRHGYRNAQTTVIAPTGTIGLLMDCDTTGVEPDFALVKFKKLAGGGYFKIANQSLRPALKALGYSDRQVQDIFEFVCGRGTLDVPMPDSEGEFPAGGETFEAFLTRHGVDEGALERIRAALPSAMDLGFLLNGWTLGEELAAKLGITPDRDALSALGLSRAQVLALNRLVCGTGTIEGAPHLATEHYPVFDCANKCGRTGQRFIATEGHIRMMAASQPFISGAISKTINLPHEASVDDIKRAYRLSWELGLKANALYRDGCKLSQPLNSSSDADTEGDGEEDEEAVAAAHAEVVEEVTEVASVAASGVNKPVEKIVERIVHRPLRRRLPDTRRSKTHKFNVAGHEGYITVGLYEDGSPGELFITMAKEGSTIGGLMDSLGTAISIALQYGVPVDSLVNKFTHQRFEPAGMTHNRDIPFAKSLVDYIFRWLGMEFVPGYREANAPQRGGGQEAAAEKEQVSVSMGNPDSTETSASTPAPADGEAGGGSTTQAAESGNGSGNGNGGNGHGHDGSVKGDRRQGGAVVDGGQSHEPGPTARAGYGGRLSQAGRSEGAELSHQALSTAMKAMQSDAPACEECGALTVRSGNFYKCVNCGASMGCS